MNTLALRDLSLAHAAIKHALYFLELEADTRAASYCSYAAEHLQNFASSLTGTGQESDEYELTLQTLQALTHELP